MEPVTQLSGVVAPLVMAHDILPAPQPLIGWHGNHDKSSRLEDTMQLANRQGVVRKMLDHVERACRVEARVAEWQSHAVSRCEEPGGKLKRETNGEIHARFRELPDEVPLATICEGGYRSSLAASLLAHEGVSRLFNVVDGMTAYRALETR